jgi:hypothetical protein
MAALEQLRTGAKVLLKPSPFGNPGTVLKSCSSRVLIEWRDLNFIGRHSPESLMLAEPAAEAAA